MKKITVTVNGFHGSQDVTVMATLTLAEMVASEDPQFAAVRAAYWAGQAHGQMVAFRCSQAAVREQVSPHHRNVRSGLLKSMAHDISASNEHSEIMGWRFEVAGHVGSTTETPACTDFPL